MLTTIVTLKSRLCVTSCENLFTICTSLYRRRAIFLPLSIDDFLLVFHCNYMLVFYCFGDITIYCLKISVFLPLLSLPMSHLKLPATWASLVLCTQSTKVGIKNLLLRLSYLSATKSEASSICEAPKLICMIYLNWKSVKYVYLFADLFILPFSFDTRCSAWAWTVARYLSVCLSVCHMPVLYRNGQTYSHNFFKIW